MKTKVFSVVALFIVIFIVYSCEKDNEKGKQLTLTGELISHSPCKSNLKSAFISVNTPDSISCIDYSFDESNNRLTIKHINAGYNCCPDSIRSTISLSGDTIVVREFEDNPKCDCDCLYDLNVEINGVDSKKYQIKVIEPYVGDQAKLSFGIDLNTDKNGSFCVTRKQYPWGMNSILH